MNGITLISRMKEMKEIFQRHRKGIYDNYKKKTRNSSGQFRIIMLAYIIIERIAL